MPSRIHDQTYWVVAMEAAIKTGSRTTNTGARRKRAHRKHRMKMSRRARLGITEAEERIHLDEFACGSINGEQPKGLFRNQNAIKPFPGAKAPATRRSWLIADRTKGTSLVTRCVIDVQHGEVHPHMLVQQCVCGYTLN